MFAETAQIGEGASLQTHMRSEKPMSEEGCREIAPERLVSRLAGRESCVLNETGQRGIRMQYGCKIQMTQGKRDRRTTYGQ